MKTIDYATLFVDKDSSIDRLAIDLFAASPLALVGVIIPCSGMLSQLEMYDKDRNMNRITGSKQISDYLASHKPDWQASGHYSVSILR